MKQNPMSGFQLCTKLIQCPTLKQRRKTLHNVDATLYQRCFNVAATLVKATSNSIDLVMSMDLEIDEKFLFC